MDPNTAMEAVTEGAKAITKFQEILQKVFEPRWTRKQADADAYADERKLQTIRDNPDMEILYTNGLINARQRTPDQLAYRAEQRQLAEAIRQEENLENVVDIALEELQSSGNVSDEPIDDDWIARFFNIVRDVNNADMQLIWGKILSGEIVKPGSFSLRTLEVVRNLSTSEANAFLKIMPYVINNGNVSFVSVKKELMEKYNLVEGRLIQLDSCGLVQVIPFTEIKFELSPNTTYQQFYNNGTMLVLKNDGTAPICVSVKSIYMLTEAGTDLFNLLDVECNEGFFEDWANDFIKNNHNEHLIATLHNRVNANDTKEYSATPYRTINC